MIKTIYNIVLMMYDSIKYNNSNIAFVPGMLQIANPNRRDSYGAEI